MKNEVWIEKKIKMLLHTKKMLLGEKMAVNERRPLTSQDMLELKKLNIKCIKINAQVELLNEMRGR